MECADMFGLFKKKTKPEKIQAEKVQADNSGYDASHVIGGLNWYHRQFKSSMKVNFILGIALCASIMLNGILFTNMPTPRYFLATPDLRLAPMVALDKPVLTQQGLLNWVTETITNAVSLDFLEWREKLTRTREHFDADAFKSFMSALEASGMLAMIKEKRLSVSAVVTHAPVIIASGIVEGKATWKIEFPMLISYESSQGVETTQDLIASVMVCRAPTATTPRGVVIKQVILKRDI